MRFFSEKKKPVDDLHHESLKYDRGMGGETPWYFGGKLPWETMGYQRGELSNYTKAYWVIFFSFITFGALKTYFYDSNKKENIDYDAPVRPTAEGWEHWRK